MKTVQTYLSSLEAEGRSGQLKNFTGIDSPNEAPEATKTRIDTKTMSIDDAATIISSYIYES